MARDILIRPVITEKSDKAMKNSVYTFIVDRKSNKLEVAKAVEAMFNVSVSAVNTTVIPGKRTVLVTPELNENLLKSSRNIQRVALTRASDLNTYQIMQTQSLVLSEGSVAKIQEMFN